MQLLAKERHHLVAMGLSILEAILVVARPDRDAPLSEYIQYYEPLYYDPEQFHRDHHRTKRSAQRVLKLDLQAHGRELRLRLRRDGRVYTPDVVIENSTGRLQYDTHRTYMGHLAGEPGSDVFGVVTSDGVFEGSISTTQESYVIEKADRFFAAQQPFHSVIYKHSDVRWPAHNESVCNADELHRKVRHWQAVEAHKRHSAPGGPESPGSTATLHRVHGSRASGASVEAGGGVGRGSRARRAAIDVSKTTCTLYLQADHLFYQKLGNNEERVIEQLTQHIQGVNKIYRVIDFDDDGAADNINFIIKRIKVHTDPTHTSYKFNGKYGVESFLEIFSEDNFDAYCLAYMFTYRDFDGGTLGLAWTGDLTNAGGVCERNGQFRGSLKSLNTGIVTVLNYGKDVPSSVSHVTMAHELGHNMGSQHDPETSNCSPGGDTGNFIMYARATSGDKPNNNRFSICSQASMSNILSAKARGSSGCFIPATNSICGNGVVEEGEECDCGWEDECKDRCCFPQVETISMGIPCTRVPKAQCSPSEGPCCSESCELIRPEAHVMCRLEGECQHASTCNGTSSSCPPSRNRRDRLPCVDETSVCYRGECTTSVCHAYGLESCQCSPSVPGDFDDPILCTLCCKYPGIDEPCLSSHRWHISPRPVPVMKLPPGSMCYDYRGTCDVFHNCLEIDSPSNFKSMFFSTEGLNSLRQWLAKHWYVAVAGGIGIITFTVVFVKLCTRKKDANKTFIVKDPIIPVSTPEKDTLPRIHRNSFSKEPDGSLYPLEKSASPRRSKSTVRKDAAPPGLGRDWCPEWCEATIQPRRPRSTAKTGPTSPVHPRELCSSPRRLKGPGGAQSVKDPASSVLAQNMCPARCSPPESLKSSFTTGPTSPMLRYSRCSMPHPLTDPYVNLLHYPGNPTERLSPPFGPKSPYSLESYGSPSERSPSPRSRKSSANSDTLFPFPKVDRCSSPRVYRSSLIKDVVPPSDGVSIAMMPRIYGKNVGLLKRSQPADV